MKKDGIKICLISSPGGHLTYLLYLRSIWKQYAHFWVTSDAGALSRSLTGETLFYIIDPQRNIIKFIRNWVQAGSLLIKESPDVIITTGSGIAIPICILGRLLGKKIVFIETAAAVRVLSLTGKIIYPLAHLFIVQWKYLLPKYPKAVYGGTFF